MRTDNEILTPAFVIDDAQLRNNLRACQSLTSRSGCELLYSPKALALPYVLSRLGSGVAGFSCSSLNEARLTRKTVRVPKAVHLVTPGLSGTQLGDVAELCDVAVLNSLSHWRLYAPALAGKVGLGLRINPGVSFADDDRYDPCRLHSKLGVPLDDIADLSNAFPGDLRELEGIHFHNNCDSTTAADLATTLQRVAGKLPHLLKHVRWVNVGGGYLLSQLHDPEVFVHAIESLRLQFHVQVFAEPGAAIVRSAGSIISRVIDLFDNGGTTIAVLDTTVNHMPEILEYEFTPTVLGSSEQGGYSYVLAGCTCLAGDHFGEVRFDEPIEIGSLIVFSECGAYTLSRANMFNGVSLPNVYCRTAEGQLELLKMSYYEDFAQITGAVVNVSV